MEQVLPLGLQFWQSVYQDPNLQRWEKVQFAWVVSGEVGDRGGDSVSPHYEEQRSLK